ncbi:MAG: hypothetical protein FH748_13085 [Balneolaceae bacterium]|nr:hypothetical protein [Balneolaceae bacterium]
MKKRSMILLLLITFSFGMTSCNGLFDFGEDSLIIRLQNDTEYSIEDVIVLFPDEQEVEYGDLAPADTSEYKIVSKAYRYAYVEGKIGGASAVVQPIDYVGESLLEPGSYTYQLYVAGADTSARGDTTHYYMDINLQED